MVTATQEECAGGEIEFYGGPSTVFATCLKSKNLLYGRSCLGTVIFF